MSGFVSSFAPLLKLFRKNKLDLFFLLVAIFLTVFSGLLFTYYSNASSQSELVNYQFSIPHSNRIIYIDIGGAVNKPDVYEVTSGARLKHALTLAGGLSDQAHKDFFSRNFNLARIIGDQEKIYIPSVLEIENNIIIENQRTLDYFQPTSTLPDRLVNNESEIININSASIDELDTLPGIGISTAQKIIQNRPYGQIEDLLNNKIVKKNIFEQIKTLISIN